MGNIDGNAYSFRRWLVALALACVSLSASAFKFDRYSEFAWTPGANELTVTPQRGAGGAWGAGSKTPTATGPGWNSPSKGLPFKPSPNASFRAKFTPAAMARAMMVPTMVLTWAASEAFQKLLTEGCVRVAGGKMEIAPNGLWEECHFTTGTQVMWSYYFNSTINSGTGDAAFQYSSSDAACTAGYEHFVSSNSSCTYYGQPCTWRKNYVAPTTCQVIRNENTTYTISLSSKSVTTTTQDGWQPASNAVVESKLASKMQEWAAADEATGYVPNDGKGLDDVLEKIINSGNAVDDVTMEPASVQTPILEAPVTKQITGTDGTSQTTTEQTRNDYDCLVISGGQAVKCSQYKRTTTTTATTSTPNGTTQTTTTTTVVTKDGETPEEEDCPPGSDLAKCAKLDAPTEDIPRETKDLTYTPDNLGFGGGSCPAPYSWTDSLGSHSIDLSPWCDKLTTVIRPLVIALALLAGVFIILPRET